MFFSAEVFNHDIGGWDVSRVTNMRGMFLGADVFNRDVGGWDVSRVTTWEACLEVLGRFNQDIGRWDVSSVTDMGTCSMVPTPSTKTSEVGRLQRDRHGQHVRDRATVFNQDIGGWDVSSVTDQGMFMGGMFFGANAFDQDIGSWDVSRVTDMSDMFDSSGRFRRGHRDWDVSASDGLGMFSSPRPTTTRS